MVVVCVNVTSASQSISSRWSVKYLPNMPLRAAWLGFSAGLGFGSIVSCDGSMLPPGADAESGRTKRRAAAAGARSSDSEEAGAGRASRRLARRRAAVECIAISVVFSLCDILM